MKNSVHSANVIHFIKIFNKVKKLQLYNPIATRLKINSLEIVKNSLKKGVKDIKKAEKNLKLSFDKRFILYYEMLSRAQSISIYVEEVASNEHHLSDLKYLLSRITGKKTYEIKPDDVLKTVGIMKKRKMNISNNMYEIRKKLFQQLIIKLSRTEEYDPAAGSLTIHSLKNFKKLLQIHKRNLTKREAELEDAKNELNNLLYHETTGATALAKRIKEYCYDVYKPASKEYRKVRSIIFERVDGLIVRSHY